ncbi:MAG: rod shape-determining protein RodA [Bacteroidales bacterium]|nr:rod shape-determining protein RodA [Bacteroidales bacterium]
MRNNNSLLANLDWATVLIFLALTFMGWVSIYSAVYDEEYSSIFDMSQRYGKQMIWIILAIVLGFIVMLTDAKFFSAFAFPIYFLILIVLVGVLLFGITIAGSKSWFQIGGFALQPSEFAKFGTALALAAYLGRLNADLSQLKTKLVAIGIIVLPALLILAQYDTGSAIVFSVFVLVLYREGMSGAIMVIALIAAILFIATIYTEQMYVLIGLLVLFGVSLMFIKRHIINIMKLIGLFLIAATFVLSVDYVFHHVLEPHQTSRINVLLGLQTDLKGAGYNVNQSKIAIGSGGFFGKGFLNGTQTKYNFVPEQSTDFIFCTVGEEYGFAGSLIVIGLYLTLLIRIVTMAERQRSVFSRVYGYGVASILFFHFAINIGMTIGLVPVIGIPLPFFSYGGSSLWAFTIMLFVFLRLDAYRLNTL